MNDNPKNKTLKRNKFVTVVVWFAAVLIFTVSAAAIIGFLSADDVNQKWEAASMFFGSVAAFITYKIIAKLIGAAKYARMWGLLVGFLAFILTSATVSQTIAVKVSPEIKQIRVAEATEKKRLADGVRAEYKISTRCRPLSFSCFSVDEAAKKKRLADEAAKKKRLADEAAKKKQQAARQQNPEYALQASISEAWVYCSVGIEGLAKYQSKWTKGYGRRFPWISWANQARGIVILKGREVKFQNGFGAWQKMTYECDWNTKTKSLVNVRVY